MAEKEAAEAFWDFALSVYGRSAAREAFLRLQDRDGADVPMLLWCLWRAESGRAVSRTVMGEAAAFSGAWREAVVAPVRGSRKALKGGIGGIPLSLSERARARIADTEQSLEKMQMDHLAALPVEGAQGDAAALISLYAEVAELELLASDVALVLANLVPPAPRA